MYYCLIFMASLFWRQTLNAVIFLCKKPFNPSTPNMKMHFLLTVIHIFLIPLVGCLKFNINQDISSMVIISFILKSSVCDQVKVV